MRAALLMVLALAQFPNSQQVLNLGQTRDEALFTSFNRGYELPVSGIVDSAQIITEFRRAVLMVRDRVNLADFNTTEHDVTKAMEPYEGLVTFIVQVRLNLQHSFVAPPIYDLYIATGPRTDPLGAKPLKRDPVYPPGSTVGSFFTGVRLEGTFRRADIEKASAPMLIVTDDKANAIWQARIDLARYR
jgi:hypothetical protein